MNILLTNDDGYNAEGILLLRTHLSKYGRVIIVAPEHSMSAKSTSISIGVGLKLTKIDEDYYSFSGTPADCVSFSITSLNIDFDLVVSGCNNGWNISYDTIYSGTIGATLQALTLRKKTIAFSAQDGFDVMDKYFDETFEFILNKGLLSNEYVLNVNFPNNINVKGIKLSSLYYRNDDHFFQKIDDLYYAYRYLQTDFSDDIESDCYLVHNGYISITPMNRTCFDSSLLRKIKLSIK